MCLLATEGIGVFRSRHIALNQHGQAKQFNGTTHRATWLFLRAWSREPGRSVRLLDAISLDSRSLSEWIQALGVGQPHLDVLAAEWLQAWSIDLKILSTDSGRRNEVTYRPTRIRSPEPPPVNPRVEIVDPLFDSWTELEPRADRAGVSLDVSLLRQAVKLVIAKGLGSYSTFSSAMSSQRENMSEPLYRALTTESPSASAIFDAAETRSVQAGAATPILARGLLLLRLASASTASLLEAAEVTKSDLEFWWSSLGTDLGFWETAADFESLSDLWTDVAEARDAADARMSSVSGAGSVRAVSGILSREISLTQFSRAPMWLLGLD